MTEVERGKAGSFTLAPEPPSRRRGYTPERWAPLQEGRGCDLVELPFSLCQAGSSFSLKAAPDHEGCSATLLLGQKTPAQYGVYCTAPVRR